MLLFPARGGGSRPYIGDTYPRAVDALGLNDGVDDRRQQVVFHTLRHTYASWLVQAGTPLTVVAELLGHTTQQISARYGHLCPDGIAAAVARVPALDRLYGAHGD